MILYTNNRKPKKVYIKESQVRLLEDVFASGRKGKNKIRLSYNKRASTDRIRNLGSLNPMELLNTGKMDQDNADTYEVPLKGGIMSYNITSIRGTEIMHYFKNKFAKMDLDLDGDGTKESYELWMDDPEYQAFFNQFYSKVNNVITHVLREWSANGNKLDFNGISIYPVYSSSDFNVVIAKQLENRVKFGGLSVVSIDTNLFRKNLSNLQKDEKFINKNKDYYNSRMFTNGDDASTHEEYIDKKLGKFAKIESVRPLIDAYNAAYTKLDRCYSVNRNAYGDRFGEALARFYKELYDRFMDIEKAVEGMRRDSIYDKLKGTKSQVEARKTEDVWEIVKPYLRGSGIKRIPMHKLQLQDFQIKNLSNDVRMGMRNYFASDDEVVEKEMEKIKGTVFVIFDDNISGGATLSDICYQAKKLGIEYIIPITFGEMNTKYTLGKGNQVNKPTKSGKFENY